MKRCRNFTLLELLAVMGIIAVLMSMIVGVSGFASRKAANSKTASQLEKMEIALEQFRQDWGHYPIQTAGEINWPQSDFEDPDGKVYLEDYMGGEYNDAWGESFFYECPGTMNEEAFDMWSKGSDKAHGERGVNDNAPDDAIEDNIDDAQTYDANDSDDITNWKRH